MATFAVRDFPLASGIITAGTDLSAYPAGTLRYLAERGLVVNTSATMQVAKAFDGRSIGSLVNVTDYSAGVLGRLIRNGWITGGGSAGSAYVQAVMADSPLAYYRMGEPSGAVMLDSSGNGRNGTYSNVTLGATGLQTADTDKAVLFDGSTSRVSVPNAAWQNPTFLTVEAIVQYTGSGERMIASRDVGGANRQFQFYIANSSLLLSCNVWRQDNTFASAQCSPGPGPSEHVALTYDGTNIKLYLNGVLGVSTPFAGTSVAAVTAALEIGNLIGTEVWTNTIDEVAIYGTALSAARLLVHAHAAGY